MEHDHVGVPENAMNPRKQMLRMDELQSKETCEIN